MAAKVLNQNGRHCSSKVAGSLSWRFSDHLSTRVDRTALRDNCNNPDSQNETLWNTGAVLKDTVEEAQAYAYD